MEWHGQVKSWADDRYPRSRAYELDWMMDNMMGPNALWLMESLTERLHLEPGMRVLDMGCGKALSSIFLAKEFDVQVWATDLWIGAGENWTGSSRRASRISCVRSTPRLTTSRSLLGSSTPW